MLKIIIIQGSLLLCLLCQNATDVKTAEWQTGIDFTINEIEEDMEQLGLASNYPIHISKQVHFPRIFTKQMKKRLFFRSEPQVLLMFESFDFQILKDVDLAVFAIDITKKGGPAIVHKVRVRWIAINDPKIVIRNHEFGFMDLGNLRAGEGERFNQFEFDFDHEFSVIPKIVTFINGFKIHPDNHPYSIITDASYLENNRYRITTMTCCSKIRYLTVSILASDDFSFIMDSSKVDEESLSYFDITNVRDGIGRQRYSFPLSREYSLNPQTILAGGISGFEVDQNDENCFSVAIEQMHIKENRFSMSYGPGNQQCKVFELDFNVIIRLPALPEEFTEEYIEHMHQQIQKERQKEKEKDNQLEQDREKIITANLSI